MHNITKGNPVYHLIWKILYGYSQELAQVFFLEGFCKNINAFSRRVKSFRKLQPLLFWKQGMSLWTIFIAVKNFQNWVYVTDVYDTHPWFMFIHGDWTRRRVTLLEFFTEGTNFAWMQI